MNEFNSSPKALCQRCGIPGVLGKCSKFSPSSPVNSWERTWICQHGKMVLGGACLVYWFMNRYHQDHYEDLARCWPYWKGKRRAKSSHSDQKGLVEKRACLFLRHPPLLLQSKLLACSVPRFNSSTKPSQIFQEAPAAPSPEFLCGVFT